MPRRNVQMRQNRPRQTLPPVTTQDVHPMDFAGHRVQFSNCAARHSELTVKRCDIYISRTQWWVLRPRWTRGLTIQRTNIDCRLAKERQRDIASRIDIYDAHL